MNTSYSPDCEYVDGMVLERKVGRGRHAYAQSQLLVGLMMAGVLWLTTVLLLMQTRSMPA